MIIVSWNCNGGLRNKLHALEHLNADIFIIQECEDPRQSKSAKYLEWSNNHLWVGKSKNKGVGVFAKKENRISLANLEAESFRIFLPFIVNDDLKVVAVWTQATESGSFSYIGQMWKYLQLHKDYLK